MAAKEVNPADVPARYGPYEVTAYTIGYRDAGNGKPRTDRFPAVMTFNRAYLAGYDARTAE